ncbi:MAG: plasmid mobilization relaxosome protein MobC [Tannerella sp.]|jgi:hypothetical protein|nr:plasmid mobilization relaxosome protein MobC [Tannerella sp.]
MPENIPAKNKGGRPKKKSFQKKSKTVGVCFSEREYAALKLRARKANLPIGVYCHDAVLYAKVTEIVTKEDISVLKSLTNMGNNLNQLVKLAHTYRLISLQNDVQNLLITIKEIINKLSDDWKNHKRKKF